MKFKTIVSLFMLITAMNAWALDLDNPSLDDCRANAETLGYMISINAYCNLESDPDNEVVEIINDLSKRCIAQYGENSLANATKAGIFSVKEELEATGRNATCATALREYPVIFK